MIYALFIFILFIYTFIYLQPSSFTHIYTILFWRYSLSWSFFIYILFLFTPFSFTSFFFTFFLMYILFYLHTFFIYSLIFSRHSSINTLSFSHYLCKCFFISFFIFLSLLFTSFIIYAILYSRPSLLTSFFIYIVLYLRHPLYTSFFISFFIYIYLYYLSMRPTNARMWHKAVFKVDPMAGSKPTRVRPGQKYLRPTRHSSFWGASGARQ